MYTSNENENVYKRSADNVFIFKFDKKSIDFNIETNSLTFPQPNKYFLYHTFVKERKHMYFGINSFLDVYDNVKKKKT